MAEGDSVLTVTWASRERPLEPTAVLGLGAVAARLARRVLHGWDEEAETCRWRGVGSVPEARDPGSRPPALALLGEDLPWVSGVSYFGTSSEAPTLLLPTHLEPSVPLSLLQRVVNQRRLATPLLMVPAQVAGDAGDLLISAADARAVDASELRSWLTSWQERPEPLV